LDFDQAIKLDTTNALATSSASGAIRQARIRPRYCRPEPSHQQQADYTAAFNVRGLAYNAKGDSDRAIADFDQALRIDPKYSPALSNRGDTFQKKQNYDRAIADFDQAIKAIRTMPGPISAAASPTRTRRTTRTRSRLLPSRQTRCQERGRLQRPRLQLYEFADDEHAMPTSIRPSNSIRTSQRLL